VALSPSPPLASPEAPVHPAAAGRRWRVGALVAAALAATAWALSRPRVPQDPAYHAFADARPLLGVPHGWNVLTNLAFAAVGLAGLHVLSRARLRDERERASWAVFLGGVTLTALGSAGYHLAPTNGTLVWDRLPMTLGFMGFLAALLTERVDPRAGRALLVPLVVAGGASVGWWWLTEQAGAGDLRPYLLVQFFPLVATPLVLALFPRAYTGTVTYVAALVLYAGAKVAEAHDAALLVAIGVSGHALKHVMAATAIGAVVLMLRTRRAVVR
jgi:hypothetical protein